MKYRFSLCLCLLGLLMACGQDPLPRVSMNAPTPIDRPVYQLEATTEVPETTPSPNPVIKPQNNNHSNASNTPASKGCPPAIKNQIETARRSITSNQQSLQGVAANTDEYNGIKASIEEDQKHLRDLLARYRSQGYTCK